MSVVINGSAGVTTNSGAVYNGIAQGTVVASTSGTSIDFTSIPSWVKRITVVFQSVSLSSTSNYLVQIGSGSVTSSGYTSSYAAVSSAGIVNAAASSTGFLIRSANATVSLFGTLVLTNISGNIWVASGVTGTDFPVAQWTAGQLTLGGALDRVRITTVSGTDTFDAGSINILYE